MRISAKAEYACVAMLHLAASFGDPQPVRIKAIAEATDIPLRFLVQILLQLKSGGLVTSVRGASGGYQLARSPEAISLHEVIRAIDGKDVTPRYALSGIAASPVVTVLLRVWGEVQKEVQAAEQRLLEGLSLTELLRRTQPRDGLVYQI
jgi:Rrf2 family protein